MGHSFSVAILSLVGSGRLLGSSRSLDSGTLLDSAIVLYSDTWAIRIIKGGGARTPWRFINVVNDFEWCHEMVSFASIRTLRCISNQGYLSN